MSFISIVKKVGTTLLGIEKVVAPAAETLLPTFAPIIAGVDKIVQSAQTTILTVEAQSPVGGGTVKAAAVVSDFQAGLQTTQQVLALEGKTLQYDDTLLQKAITDQVAAYNDFAALKASFKIVALPTAPTPAPPATN